MTEPRGKPWVDENCGNCRFWLSDRDSNRTGKDHPSDDGTCCRRAPVVVADFDRNWGITAPDSWCGEWEKRNE